MAKIVQESIRIRGTELHCLQENSGWKGEIPDAELVMLEGARHPCYLDQPNEWHERLLAFLQTRFA